VAAYSEYIQSVSGMAAVPDLNEKSIITGRRGVDTIIHNVCVSKTQIQDVFNAEGVARIWTSNWRSSAAGQWVTANSITPPLRHQYYDVTTDISYLMISAKLSAVNHTLWTLKWGHLVDEKLT
jgi:hypothetical protein